MQNTLVLTVALANERRLLHRQHTTASAIAVGPGVPVPGVLVLPEGLGALS
jgi:hypothetical protein